MNTRPGKRPQPQSWNVRTKCEPDHPGPGLETPVRGGAVAGRGCPRSRNQSLQHAVAGRPTVESADPARTAARHHVREEEAPGAIGRPGLSAREVRGNDFEGTRVKGRAGQPCPGSLCSFRTHTELGRPVPTYASRASVTRVPVWRSSSWGRQERVGHSPNWQLASGQGISRVL
jgi:hypothetical protein